MRLFPVRIQIRAKIFCCNGYKNEKPDMFKKDTHPIK